MRGWVVWVPTLWVGGEGAGFKDCERWGAHDATMTMSPIWELPPTGIMTFGGRCLACCLPAGTYFGFTPGTYFGFQVGGQGLIRRVGVRGQN